MRDYFRHLELAAGYEPAVYFTPASAWDESNPWFAQRSEVCPTWTPETADALFLGGLDWLALDPEKAKNWPAPTFNLIQHIRHTDHAHPLFQFLPNKAIRLCVSEEVADAVRASGKANGPVFAIPNGVDFGGLPQRIEDSQHDIDLLIVGLKNREMAEELQHAFAMHDLRIEALFDLLPRAEFLGKIARSTTTAFLPNQTEGFYLPALEAMLLGSLVVCPDCIGNRSFCLDTINCFRPAYALPQIIDAVSTATTLPSADRERLLAEATRTASGHDIARERTAFYDVLNKMRDLWNICPS